MNLDTIVCMGALEFMATLPDASCDMILCDLPYGSTACSWDEIIPFAPMWEQFTRVSKPRAAIVLTASQPFTSKLVMSNLQMFHESLIWDKTAATGYLDANRKHMRQHEDVIVFCAGQPEYTPQLTKGKAYTHHGRSSNFSGYGVAATKPTTSNGDRYPKTILSYSGSAAAYARIHPTQKPVALFEYLIRTYTQSDQIVLDCCMGSGTTAIAARNTGRHFIGCDNGTDEKTGKLWATIANERLAEPYTLPMLEG